MEAGAGAGVGGGMEAAAAAVSRVGGAVAPTNVSDTDSLGWNSELPSTNTHSSNSLLAPAAAVGCGKPLVSTGPTNKSYTRSNNSFTLCQI